MDMLYTYLGLIAGNIIGFIFLRPVNLFHHILATGLTLLIMIALKHLGFYGGTEGYHKVATSEDES